MADENILEALSNLAVAIDEVRPSEKNPRRGDVEAISRSLVEFGQHKPLVATRDGTIIIGNHTWQAAKKLGWTQVAVAFTDDDPATAKARLLADNKTSDLGRNDNAEVAALLSEIADDAEELLAATGYQEGEVDALLRLAQPSVTPEWYSDGDDDDPIRPPDLPPVALPGTAGGGSAPPRGAIPDRPPAPDRPVAPDRVPASSASPDEHDRGSVSNDRPPVSNRASVSNRKPVSDRSSVPNAIRGEHTLHLGDAIGVMEELIDDSSIDCCITDPGVGSLADTDGWWKQVPGPPFWDEVFRVMKPGAHLLVFAGRKTFHRVAYVIEESGFEIRDTLMWLYGKGMPMALDIGQAVDKKLGGDGEPYFRKIGSMTDAEREAYVADGNPFYGYGTELKPCWEPIMMFRKPIEGTNAENIMRYGTGSLNIDASRIEGQTREAIATWIPEGQGDAHGLSLDKKQLVVGETNLGRWPPDAIIQHLDDCHPEQCVDGCPVSDLNEQAGGREPVSRFFYCPKASKREKNEGLPPHMVNDHKAVKPIEVCEWLVRLAAPTSSGDGSPMDATSGLTGPGVVLDPFCGTGSVGVAANNLGYGFVGIDHDAHVINDLAAARLAHQR